MPYEIQIIFIFIESNNFEIEKFKSPKKKKIFLVNFFNSKNKLNHNKNLLFI